MAGTVQGKKSRKEPFYLRKGPLLFCRIAGTAAGGMLLAAPFLSWRMVFVKTDEVFRSKLSLFDVVRYVCSREYTGHGWRIVLYLFLFGVILFSGLAMLYLSWRDQFRPGSAAQSTFLFDELICKYRWISRVAVPLMAIVSVILLKHNKIFDLLYEQTSRSYNNWKSMIDTYTRLRGDSGGMYALRLPGGAAFLFYMGILLYILAEFLRYVINTLNEPD